MDRYYDHPRTMAEDPFNPPDSQATHVDRLQPGGFNHNTPSVENLLPSGVNNPYPFTVAGSGNASSRGFHGPVPTADTLWAEGGGSEYVPMNTLGQKNLNIWGMPKSNRKKWIVAAVVVLVAGILIAGVSVAVVVAIRKNSDTSSSSSSSTSGGASGVSQTNPGDPSQFSKNPNFHQSFYGMAYTPTGSLPPSCGNKLSEVIYDMQIMSQLTKRVRLYGSDCNVSALVLEAIKQTKVDMQVYLGNYALADNTTAYTVQRDAIKSAIQTYGTDHIAGITVGNEFILNYVTQKGVSDPNGAVADEGAAILVANIKDTRSMLSSLGVKIPVGNSDAGSFFNNKVLAQVDYGLANVHPWFANVSAEQGAAWTATFFNDVDIAQANNLSNKPSMYIAETGWPTQSSDLGNANNGASTASEKNLQTFLDTFVCQANTNGTGYFFFEFCDEKWKDDIYGGVEGWWGLLTANRTLKNVQIPNCPAS